MGYQRKLYKFRFEDFEGLEVVTRPLSMEQALAFGDAVDLDALQKGTATSEAVLKLADLFVSSMVSWTVEEEDGSPAPLPASGKELLTEDAAMAMAMLTEWQQRTIRVAPPLPESSNSGETPDLEQSIPMEPLSLSPANSAAPG